MLTDITGPRPVQPMTVAPVTYPERAASPMPEFCRLPRSGQRCMISGLSRSKLNELILGSSPAVKSVVLRKRGTTRGIRLINVSSLLDYIHQQAAEPVEAVL